MPLDSNEQYLLELINRARLDPQGEAARYGLADLNRNLPAGTISGLPLQALAPNDLLNAAAAAHSQWMLNTDVFSHAGVNGSSPGDRMASAGYVFSGSWTWGENISWTGSFPTSPNLVSAIEQQHQGLFLSDGHRANILADAFREIGVGQEAGQFLSEGTNWNASMVTENFARSGGNVFITGVAYADANNNKFYNVGEGAGGVSVSVAGAGATTTYAAGGYSIGVTAGVKTVAFGPGAIQVDASAGNAKIDLVNNDTFYVSVDATLVSGVKRLVLLGAGPLRGAGDGGANTLAGNRGANVLNGGAGNDTLIGGLGDDTLNGGGDTDTAVFAGLKASYVIMNNNNGTWTVSGADGVDTLTDIEFLQFDDQLFQLGSSGGQTFDGGPGDDTLVGTAFGDILRGFGGNDVIDGKGGADSIDGGDGNDTITFDVSDILVDGGAGFDTGVFSGATTAQARAFDMTAHGFERLQWVVNGNVYSLVLSAGNTRTETVVDTAGAEAGFRQRTTLLDSLGREELVDIIADSGQRYLYDYDPSGATAWSSILQVFAVGGALDYTDTRYDNGSRVVRDEDQASAGAWKSITTTYAPGGAVDYQDNVYDDGSRIIYDGDQANAFNWTSISTTYAPGGAVDYQDYVYDDGRRVIYDSDQTHSAPWSTRTTSYAPGNALDVQDTKFDDGSRLIYDWDQADRYAWKTFETFYNAAGVAISQRVTYDNNQVVVFKL